MRVSLIVILLLLSLTGFGQSEETFLLYDNSTGFLRESRNDTTFCLDAFVVLDAKNLTIRSFPRYSGYEIKKRKVKYARVGDLITFFDEGKSEVAEILRGPFFRGGSKARYALVPINDKGLKVAPFEGQLIEHYPSGGKLKFILDTIRGKWPQMTYLISYGQTSHVEQMQPMVYLDEKYFNLTALNLILGWFQLNKTISDSIWHVTTYPGVAHKGDSTAWQSTFTKKGLLSKSALRKITENLQGKWSQTSGFELSGKLAPDSSKVIRFLDSLKVCKYIFTFNKDNLILERSSLNPEMKRIDTLGYSINSTGDWIWTTGENDVDIILDKIDSKSARFSVTDHYGIDNKTCTGSLLLYLRKE